MSSDALHFPEAVRNPAKADSEVAPPESIESPASTRRDLVHESGDPKGGWAEQELLSISSQHDFSDEFLLADAGNGSKEAVGLLFRRYRHVVVSVARRILRDETEAEDLCQEVFLYLFQKANLFDASKGTASSWIVQIAYHRAMNRRGYLQHRQHYNAQELNEECTSVQRPQLLIDEIAAKTLLDRIRGLLSSEQQATLELHFFEGYTFREIAEKTNQPLGNVRHHYYRGLERLRSMIYPKKDT
jgi:RNA polymerase sigma-70 factor, ECF subfamily